VQVRIATKKDFGDIVEMLHHFHEELPYKEFVGTDTESLSATLSALDANPNAVVLVATTDKGDVVGTVGGLLIASWFNYSHVNASTLFWYVQKDHRRSKAGKLLAAAIEQWAKENGAQSFVFNSLANKHQKRMNNIYLSKGYTPIETTFVKEL
jgi:GNAT superfamily N-acetyltransferase